MFINEFYEIVNGQHKLEVAKELQLHINFIEVPGLGIEYIKKYHNGKAKEAVLLFLKIYLGIK